MKKIVIIIALSILAWPRLCASPLPQGLLQTAGQADACYRQDHFQEAIVLYEQVLSEGYASAELYYNLGNAYYREQQLGKSILNYERALRLDPGMAEAKENLRLANGLLTDRITQLPKLFLVKWWEGFRGWLTPSAWRVVWLVVFALFAAAVVLMRCGASSGMRKVGFSAAVAALLLLVVCGAALLSAKHVYNARAAAIVVEPVANVKTSPEEASADVMMLHEGTKVTVTESLAEWNKVALADGTTGWCRSTAMERI